VAVSARSSWGIVFACVAFWAVLQQYYGFRFSKKDKKLIERADLLRSMARGIDNSDALQDGSFFGRMKPATLLFWISLKRMFTTNLG
jgi:hypothetical protein